jgi:hypothetical protein
MKNNKLNKFLTKEILDNTSCIGGYNLAGVFNCSNETYSDTQNHTTGSWDMAKAKLIDVRDSSAQQDNPAL